MRQGGGRVCLLLFDPVLLLAKFHEQPRLAEPRLFLLTATVLHLQLGLFWSQVRTVQCAGAGDGGNLHTGLLPVNQAPLLSTLSRNYRAEDFETHCAQVSTGGLVQVPCDQLPSEKTHCEGT